MWWVLTDTEGRSSALVDLEWTRSRLLGSFCCWAKWHPYLVTVQVETLPWD